jgi:hypothetical protein
MFSVYPTCLCTLTRCALGQEAAEPRRKANAERQKAQRLQDFDVILQKLRAEPNSVMVQKAVTGAIALHTNYAALAPHMNDARFVAAVSVLDCSTPEAMAASRAIENQATDSYYKARKREASDVVVSFLCK